MSAVTARIVLQPAAPGAGPLESLVQRAREALAATHVRRFRAAHAREEQIIADRAAAARPEPGTVVLEDGALPRAVPADYAQFVDVAPAGRAPWPHRGNAVRSLPWSCGRQRHAPIVPGGPSLVAWSVQLLLLAGGRDPMRVEGR